jgi:hypothetical protein
MLLDQVQAASDDRLIILRCTGLQGRSTGRRQWQSRPENLHRHPYLKAEKKASGREQQQVRILLSGHQGCARPRREPFQLLLKSNSNPSSRCPAHPVNENSIHALAYSSNPNTCFSWWSLVTVNRVFRTPLKFLHFPFLWNEGVNGSNRDRRFPKTEGHVS